MAINNHNNGRTSSMSWIQHKEAAKSHFQQSRYEEALQSYRAALFANPPEAEKQIILSNVVACRLKIGGPAMAAAAVEESKQCIALNPRWAKGHVRLASAYVALGNHSNDACNALQRAISLDPSNTTARQMLTKELRRDRVTNPPPEASAPSEDFDDGNPPPRQQQPANHAAHDADINHGIDESLSMTDRLKFYWIRVVTWYHEQNDDVKTLMKVVVGILVLYVLFGGRFGLGGHPSVKGHYGRGNAYDRYRSTGRYEANYRGGPSNNGYPRQGGGSNPYANTHPRTGTYGTAGGGYQRQAYEDSYGYAPPQTRGASSFHFPNLMDGSLPSMLILGAIVYGCHRMGINPFQVLMMMNMMGAGQRRHGRGMGYGMGGMGGLGMAGMGYGMARNAGMFGRGAPNHRPGYY